MGGRSGRSGQSGRVRRPVLLMLMGQAGTLILLLWALGDAQAGTLSVSSANSYTIPRTGYAWGSGGLPVQPSVEWRLGDGLDYDTTGAGVWRNYGSQALTTGLTIGNAPGLAEGIIAPNQSACMFNGSTNYLILDDLTALDILNGTSFSIGAVFMPTTTGAFTMIQRRGGSPANRSYGLQYGLSASRVSVVCNDFNGDMAFNSTHTFALNQWHIAIMSVTISSPVCSLWVDGVFEGTSGPVAAFDSTSGSAKWNIGRDPSAASRLFNGGIAWASVWVGTALSSANVAAIQAAMIPTGAAGKPFPSIQSACRQATASDLISVGTGLYRETIEVTKALTITSANSTFGQRPTLLGAGIPTSAGVNGFIATAAAKIGYLDIRGYSGGVGVYADSTSDGSLFHHLTIDSCLTGAKFYGSCNGDSVVNCTIDGESLASSYGFLTVGSSEAGAASLVWLNNIVFGAATGLAVDAGKFNVSADYNDVIGGTTAYVGISSGAHDVQVDPNFKGAFWNDYTLRTGSKVVNQGYLLYGGAPPFEPNQFNPDIGAWEQSPGGSIQCEAPWARDSWGGRR